MVNNGRNVQMNRRQIENRRRRRLRSGWIFLFARVVVLTVIVFCIRNIYVQLEEMQMELKRIEIQKYGAIQTSTKVQMPEEMDYVSSIDAWEVGNPVERTEAEVLQRLGELAQESSVIDEIYQSRFQYPEELLAALANNPEMADFVSRYPGGTGATGGIMEFEKEQEFPLFLQWDPRWGYESYGESCIGLAGCGPTCLSMVLFYLTRDETLTPDKIAKYSMENGYYVKGSGTAWALMEDISKLYDLKVTKPRMSDRAMKSVLDDGEIIICAMGGGDFTVSGHFIVIYGYDEKGFKVNDPNCVARSRKRWTFEELETQIKNIWAYKKVGE